MEPGLTQRFTFSHAGPARDPPSSPSLSLSPAHSAHSRAAHARASVSRPALEPSSAAPSASQPRAGLLPWARTSARWPAPRLTALGHLQTFLPRSLRVLTGHAEITAVISGGSLPSRAPGSRALPLNRPADPLPPIPCASAAHNPSRRSPPRTEQSRAPCATTAALLCCPPAPPEHRRGLASAPGATPRPPRTTPAPATAGIPTGVPPR